MPDGTYDYISQINDFRRTVLRFEGFEDNLPDPNLYYHGAIICVRDGYNTRFYVNRNSNWEYLNTALNTQQNEDVLVGYTGYGDEGLSSVSPDFTPIRVDDNLNIVRNDAHFKTMLDNVLVELGVVDAE